MATPPWLEASLRRSASLAREVLARASRRSVDWSSGRASWSSTSMDEDTYAPLRRRNPELDDAFATIADFMARTTSECRRVYSSGCCAATSDMERNHMYRFHQRPGRSTPAPTPRRNRSPPTQAFGRESADEDYYIEVSPGTYSVTASLPESQQQTHMVSIGAGESVNLTFNL